METEPATREAETAQRPAPPPKTRNLKLFAGEYVMIVLSIVTALALENGVRQFHQAREAREAARNLDAEIAANIAEVGAVIAHNEAEIRRIGKLREILLAEIKSGATDERAVKQASNASNGHFNVSIRTPSLQREAWDVAVANQALSYMPQDQLMRYARQYANMRDTQSMLLDTGSSFIDWPHLSDTMSNMEMNDITARGLYRVLTQMSFVHESNTNNMRSLVKLLAEEQRRTQKSAKP
jgi:type II secretory pathway pseudopilin PulG